MKQIYLLLTLFSILTFSAECSESIPSGRQTTSSPITGKWYMETLAVSPKMGITLTLNTDGTFTQTFRNLDVKPNHLMFTYKGTWKYQKIDESSGTLALKISDLGESELVFTVKLSDLAMKITNQNGTVYTQSTFRRTKN